MTGDADPLGETFPEHGSPEELEQRLRLRPLGDTVRGFVFSAMRVLLEAGTAARRDLPSRRCPGTTTPAAS